MAKVKFKATQKLGLYQNGVLFMRDGDIVDVAEEEADRLVASFPDNFRKGVPRAVEVVAAPEPEPEPVVEEVPAEEALPEGVASFVDDGEEAVITYTDGAELRGPSGTISPWASTEVVADGVEAELDEVVDVVEEVAEDGGISTEEVAEIKEQVEEVKKTSKKGKK